jgi:hypothetical protein
MMRRAMPNSKSIAGLAVQARAAVWGAHELWEGSAYCENDDERMFIEAVCRFTGVLFPK